VIPNHCWINVTGQRWKLIVIYLLFAALATIICAANVPTLGQLVSTNPDFVSLYSIPIGTVTLAWTALAVKCPNCTTRTGWWYLRNRGVTQWFTAFVGAQRCPVCGYDGNTGSLTHLQRDDQCAHHGGRLS
jgi:hypothetical protein